MLTIHIPVSEEESFNSLTSEFIPPDTVALDLEHSLVSLYDWESKWEKPFLGSADKTPEETISYVEIMCLTKNPPEGIFHKLSQTNVAEIHEYLNAKMTATWFNEKEAPKNSREVITAELIYYWMISLNIPFECQYWHLNRLLTLVRVCNLKNAPQKKMSKGEIAARNRRLNAERQAKFKTRG